MTEKSLFYVEIENRSGSIYMNWANRTLLLILKHKENLSMKKKCKQAWVCERETTRF